MMKEANEMVQIEPADRALFKSLAHSEGWSSTDHEIDIGGWDDDSAMQTIARHRLANDAAAQVEQLIRQLWILTGSDGRVRASVVEEAIRATFASPSIESDIAVLEQGRVG